MVTKVKDSEIKKLSTTKREFVSALKKVSQRIEKPDNLRGRGAKSG